MVVEVFEQVAPGTVPDVDRLWEVFSQVMGDAQAGALALVRWRVAADDLMALKRVRRAGQPAVTVRWDGDRPIYQLFGADVQVVEPCPGRWPELVLAVDRRL